MCFMFVTLRIENSFVVYQKKEVIKTIPLVLLGKNKSTTGIIDSIN